MVRTSLNIKLYLLGLAGLMLFLPTRVHALRIGVMADSCCDEYRADDNRGGIYGATTFNFLELLVRYRGIDMGPWGVYGGPRRSGYAYNWARSGATAASLIAEGQHTGLAGQVRPGLIDLVVMDIGSNDFAYYRSDGYGAIYNGTISGAQLQTKLDRIVANIKIALDTVHEAGARRIALMGVPDWGMSPVVVARYPDATRRALVTKAVEDVNVRIRLYIESLGGLYLDPNAFGLQLLATLTPDGYILYGGEKINFLRSGDEPHHLILGDDIHAGTVANGIIANYYILELAKRWGINILPFSEDEILYYSGISKSLPKYCVSDINLDTTTDLTDYSLLVADLFRAPPSNSRADINQDKLVDLSDYSLLTSRLLKTCGEL